MADVLAALDRGLLIRQPRTPSSTVALLSRTVAHPNGARVVVRDCFTQWTVPMDRQYFAPIDPTLPEAEQHARAKRQRHAEWGVAIARLGGLEPTAMLLQELQLYINGELGLQELSQRSLPAGPADHVYQAVARREQFVG